jgi:hypothetical protein
MLTYMEGNAQLLGMTLILSARQMISGSILAS